MNEFECGCSWHFAKQPDASQDVGPNNAAAEHFSTTPYPSLIRESIQNSLDVVLDKSQPLRMKFEFGRLRSRSFESFCELRYHIKGVVRLYGETSGGRYQEMLDCFERVHRDQKVIEYIKISDYNTKGMDYEPSNSSPFQAFVRAVGLTVKDEDSSGGSFGFGKAAYFSMSPIHTVLVSTMTEKGNVFFEGAASLSTHLYKDELGKEVKYQHYGFYDNQGGKQPVSSTDDIPSKFRREEVGTDIYIMGVDGSEKRREEAYDEMVKAALRHFWLAFMHNKLEVEIGDVCINAESLNELMCKHFPELTDKVRSGDNYSPRPYYEAVKNANTSNDFVQIDKQLPLLGQVSLYLWKNKEAKDGIVHMRKQRMFIYRSRSYSSSYGYYAVFFCPDINGNALLKSIEDPSHRKWQPQRTKNGKQIVDEFQSFIDESIRETFESQESLALGITGLEDYLFVPEELVGSNRDDVEDNPFFGEPSDEEQEEGTSPISVITLQKPTVNNAIKEPAGKVVTVTGNQGAKRMQGGELGGHERSRSKKKAVGSGNSPDTTAFAPSENRNNGRYLQNIPVRYRVVAELREGKFIHSIIIHTDFDVERGQIEVVVGGVENDEVVNIVRSSVGEVSGNIVTNLRLTTGMKNVVELELADKMKHAIKLTAYEFK